MNDQATKIIHYFERLIEARKRLSPEQLAEFDRWKHARRPRADHDWPGWLPLIGPFPGRPANLTRMRRAS